MMKKLIRMAACILGVVGVLPLSAQAEEEWFKNVTISGFVDTYYGYNFNDPASRVNAVRNFDLESNTFSLNLAEIVVQRKAEPVGLRIDLDFGPTTDLVHAAEPPSATGAGGTEGYKHIQQAYVTWVAPVGKGLTIDVGKFVTHMGSEVIETKDNWNYSRSLLFAWAIPYYHSGIRANIPLSDQLFVNGYLYNGWNNVIETNDDKTFGAQIGITPTPQLPILLNWIGGPEQLGDEGNWRHVFDAVATLNLSDKLSLMVNYDYGREEQPAGAGSAKWQGVALYARFAPNDTCAFIPRVEWYQDNGIFSPFPGAGNTLYEVTLTAEHKISNGLLARLEYRRDMSHEKNVFEDDDGLITEGHQDTVTLGLVAMF